MGTNGPDGAGAGARPGWMRRLVGYCWRFRRALVLGFAASVVGSAVAAGIPLLVRQVVDEVILAGRHPLAPWLVLLVGAAVVRFGASVVRRYCAGRLSFGVDYALRRDLFAALQQLDGAQQDRLRTGQVVSRAIADVRAVEASLRNAPQLASNAVLFVLSVVIMVVLSPLLALVALVAAPVLFVSARRSGASLSPVFREYSQQAGVLAGVVEAAVSGVRVVKGFGQEAREQERFEAAARRLFVAGVRRARAGSNFFPALRAIPAMAQVGVLAFGGWLALSERITLGTFLAFATYLASTVAPVRWLVNQLPATQEAKAGLLRVFEIVDARPTVVDRPDAEDAPTGPAAVELQDVTFGYDADRPVLHRVSLRVDPGETLALVGGTGSGKSTVALLLARFYEAQEGSVRLGGREVRELTLASLRARLGLVFEESFLFSDTVRSNIAFGRPDATDDEVVAAGAAAEADAFVRALPSGYDTVIGERGVTLSGGQRQRVALARALLADPAVLVLDDATSAVDAGVEAEIHTTLRRVLRGRTTLLVAHRRSTLQLADRIAVLHQGSVVDVGTHDELLERCPRYRLLLSGHDTELDGAGGGDGADVGTTVTGAEPVDDVTTEGVPPPAESGMVTSALWSDPPSAGRGGVFDPTGDAGIAESTDGTARARAENPDLDLADARQADPEFGPRRLVRPIWVGLALVVLAMSLESVAELALPWLTRMVVDDGVARNDPGVVAVASVVALGAVLATWGIRIVHERSVGRTGERMRLWLGTKTYAHLQRLGLDFYERERGGQIMTRMTDDLGAITRFAQRSLGTLVVAVVSFVGVLIVMFTIEVRLTVAVLTLLPVFVAAVFVYRHWSNRAYDAARDRLSELNADFQENVAGIRVTQAYGRQAYNEAAFGRVAENHRQARMRAERYLAVFSSFTELVGDLAIAIVLAVGAARVDAGTLTAGGIIAFILYVNLLFSPFQLLSIVVDAYQLAQVGMRRIRELLRTPTTTPEADHPLPVDRLAGRVELDAVRFTYPGTGTEALHGVDVRIAPGETVAVVGETGAGKSTLLKLVARFYDPTVGLVRIDGVDLRELELAAFRGRIGVVPQETYLFSGSVRDTIAYGRPDASDVQVELAARAVGAHEMIATLRHGYLHSVGERGQNLSAGQRQLLALARAQLVEPDILLLDEATAALDLATEAAVVQATRRLSEARTTLIIAHRLTTARRADRIVVLSEGRVVECGAHDELVAAGGRYAELWSAYTGTYAEAAR